MIYTGFEMDYMNEAEDQDSPLAKIKASKAAISSYNRVKSILDKFGDVDKGATFTAYGSKEIHMSLKGDPADLKKALADKTKQEIGGADDDWAVKVSAKFRVRVIDKSWINSVKGTALILDFNPK